MKNTKPRLSLDKEVPQGERSSKIKHTEKEMSDLKEVTKTTVQTAKDSLKHKVEVMVAEEMARITSKYFHDATLTEMDNIGSSVFHGTIRLVEMATGKSLPRGNQPQIWQDARIGEVPIVLPASDIEGVYDGISRCHAAANLRMAHPDCLSVAEKALLSTVAKHNGPKPKAPAPQLHLHLYFQLFQQQQLCICLSVPSLRKLTEMPELLLTNNSRICHCCVPDVLGQKRAAKSALTAESVSIELEAQSLNRPLVEKQ
ncbi:hypothetical protein Pelo_10963 [Pelomyxa schiedti]|nr:hypothetical protein Pelo_10963 [Pelomyxa schiedti]